MLAETWCSSHEEHIAVILSRCSQKVDLFLAILESYWSSSLPEPQNTPLASHHRRTERQRPIVVKLQHVVDQYFFLLSFREKCNTKNLSCPIATHTHTHYQAAKETQQIAGTTFLVSFYVLKGIHSFLHESL